MPFSLGEKFPNFDAEAFGHEGKFNLYDYLGDSYGLFFRWVLIALEYRGFLCLQNEACRKKWKEALGVIARTLLLRSHPNDFTPVCTSELAQLAKLAKQFEQKNCKLVGFSCNDLSSHKEWAKDILAYGGMSGELPFPIVCDPDRSLAAKLGIMDPKEKDTQGLPLTCRSVFYIGRCKSVKANILYPATIGRSFKEILRLVEEYPVSTPVEWTPGEHVCVIPDLSTEEANKKFPKGVHQKDLPSGKHYIRMTPDPRS
ncbi:hypothetical protein Efla_007733 [Eimeria flavescens]